MRSEARIETCEPDILSARLVEQLAKYDIEFTTVGPRTTAEISDGRCATIDVGADRLDVGVEGPDLGELEMLRSFVASHLVELAGEAASIRWSGAPTGALFANFREVVVKSVVDIAPHLRRLTLTGPDIARFASDDDLHVRAYFPPAGLDVPEWPHIADDGRTIWPEAAKRPALRYYTIRRVDIETSEIDIDFVMHAAPGPGSDFAGRATPGAILGIAGPLGRTIGPAAWHLLAGDETALPAIARILETMEPHAQGTVIIEIGGPDDEIALARPPGMMLRWLHRRGDRHDPDLLIQAVKDASWPPHDDVFVWAGCETQTAKAMRTHVEKERGVTRRKQLIVGYWSR